MARPLRIEFAGAVYHVTSRGNRREPIFEDDVDREALLDTLAETLGRFDACALAWCLMGNHYHFVLQTRQSNLSRLMRHLNGVYTQRFNRRHGKVGHLFQGRFKAILVQTDSYLSEVCRYVDLNPVRAGMVTRPWSSYQSFAALAPARAWHSRDLLWAQFDPNDDLSAAQRYAHFVREGHGVRLWEKALHGQIYLGDEAFAKRMQLRVGTDPGTEVSRAHKHPVRKGLGSVNNYSPVALALGWARNKTQQRRQGGPLSRRCNAVPRPTERKPSGLNLMARGYCVALLVWGDVAK